MIYFLNLKKSAAEAHRLFVERYGEVVRSCREWFRKFKNGEFDIEDKERSGRPKVYEVCPESIRPTFISRAGVILHHRADLGMALSTLVALFSTVVLSSNRCPLSGFLSFGNSQKSQGVISGLYGGCRSNAILCLLRNCCTRFDECAGALSW